MTTKNSLSCVGRLVLRLAPAADGARGEIKQAMRFMWRRGSTIARDQIRGEGFSLHPIEWRRGSMNPFRILRTIMETRQLYRRLRPDLVHHVALVPSVIGSIAALACRWRGSMRLTGLRVMFSRPQTAKARLLRAMAESAARLAAAAARAPPRWCKIPTTVPWPLQFGVPPERIALIPGSGIDVDSLTPLPEPEGPFTVGFVGRLLDDKGVRSLVRAHDILAERGVAVRLLLAGAPDPSNPASIPEHVLAGWRNRPIWSCSATSTIFERFGRRRMSPSCHRGAKDCRKACWKRRPAAGR